MATNTNTNRNTGIDWRQIIVPSIVSLLFFTVLTGALYPALITGIAQVLFPREANGSLLTDADGSVIGSELIGQQFSDLAYFWGRPSATWPVPYNGGASSGSNLGPLNPVLIGPEGTVQGRIAALEAANAAAGVTVDAPIPVDLVTASGSGLDPHISPAAASYQVARVAALRGADPMALEDIIERYTEGRTFGILGEPRLNVVLLNLALDAEYPPAAES